MKRLVLLLILTLPAVAFLSFTVSSVANAVSPSDFKPGRIIDDAIFYNKNAMGSAQGVQNFLNTHVPACDTWGTGPSGYGNLTKAQYAQQMGWHGPPYACLQNYHENPTTGETSFEKGGGAFAGGQSAAQIIWNASQEYGINPQVLLVMLRKESAGPLTADNWPLKSQYKYAMGYACPDSGPNYSANCAAEKSGFYNQVRLAAWQLRYYANNINTYNYRPYRTNYIQYNPNPACGGKDVYIENIATASLYIYTPYVPNDAALNAYPGTAHCGAYGNRNFFMMFNEWFGSTLGSGLYLNKSLGGELAPNTTIQSGDFISSPDGRFVMTMQHDGNLIIHNGKKIVWHSNSSGNYGATARFQSDGNFVVYRSDNTPVWFTGTNGTGANKLFLKDDGNLYVHANSAQIYATDFKVSPSAITNRGAQLPSGGRLDGGDYLRSTGDRYTLVMQDDGNLVVYTAGSNALWNSRTFGNPGAYAAMQADGNLVVYSAAGKALWGAAGKGPSNLVMQSDGNLVVYNSSGRPTWNSGTDGKF